MTPLKELEKAAEMETVSTRLRHYDANLFRIYCKSVRKSPYWMIKYLIGSALQAAGMPISSSMARPLRKMRRWCRIDAYLPPIMDSCPTYRPKNRDRPGR